MEHLENLRKSDPLVNLAAWHDWSELRAQIKTSRHAWVHQQAVSVHGGIYMNRLREKRYRAWDDTW